MVGELERELQGTVRNQPTSQLLCTNLDLAVCLLHTLLSCSKSYAFVLHSDVVYCMCPGLPWYNM